MLLGMRRFAFQNCVLLATSIWPSNIQFSLCSPKSSIDQRWPRGRLSDSLTITINAGTSSWSVPLRGSYLIHLKLVHWSLLGGLLTTNVLTFAALLMNTEIVEIWKKRSDTLAVYEERVGQLSLSVDRLRFRELANWGSASLKLQELGELQMRVEEKLSTVQALAEAAAGMGVARLRAPGRQTARALAEESGGQIHLISLRRTSEPWNKRFS